MHRRSFLKNTATLMALAQLPSLPDPLPVTKTAANISVLETRSNFEREKLIRPFGFKGGYLTELWQTAVQLRSEKNSGTGLATQSVLYGDADLFASFSEAGGNALLYALTEKALRLVRQTSFSDPVDLIDKIRPSLLNEAVTLTGKKDINPNFLLNALVSIDNAAWQLYANEKVFTSFDSMLPTQFRSGLSYRNEKVGVLFQVSYGMPLQDIKQAVDEGYFLIKIKTGQPGSQAEMLKKDMDRLSQVHELLRNERTTHTPNGKLFYTMDSNARYERKETLHRFLDHAAHIGALDQILFMEEPFVESNDELLTDIAIPIGADESVHDFPSALRRIQQGYRVMVLKGVAKTLSESIKVAQLAHDHHIPCICADLTVNPILIDWNKNLAARVAPYPGLNMGIMETNGDRNYRNWQQMLTYHPFAGAIWTRVKNGVFELTSDYFQQSGGILASSPHYQDLLHT